MAAAVASSPIYRDEYRIWRDNPPPNLEGSQLAEKLDAIVELDFEELPAIDPPRRYGRDRPKEGAERHPADPWNCCPRLKQKGACLKSGD